MTISRIAVVGGHGKIALLLTELLAEKDVAVRSIIRNPDQAEEIRGIGGDPVVCDAENASVAELQEAFGDAEAVVFAAGAGGASGAFRKYTMDLAGSVRSIQAALAANIQRFVQISFIGAKQPTQPDAEEVFAAYWACKREADNALRAADLDWTIVSPGGLTDDPATGELEVGENLERGGTTRRGDVARFIAHILDDERTFGRDFDILDGEQPLGDALDAHLGS
ncbi:SDR family oxidoreductase [Brevibacterium daeguense]|uniref:SDR family oxidoreductase n=1 Tax=Brevibacterium daeguense TaxID=909936 RepID=A0ABP8EMD2_9MICO|nr:NAD(P)H-binding protein [Brevibacterium daeguense]